MKFWHALPFMQPGDAIALAEASDESGYDGITVPDHLFYPRNLKSPYPYSDDGRPGFNEDTPWPDPWVLIAAMAARTKNIRFTTNVYIAPARDLFTVAKSVATAAVVSNNRVALGVGAGWMQEEFEQTGQDFESRGKRLNEMMGVLPRLWTGDWVEHHGEHYDFDEVKISPVPSEPIPIWVGGHSPAALKRAVLHADGWIGVDYKIDEAEEILGRLRQSLVRAKRADEPFEVILALWAHIDADLCQKFADLGVTGFLCAPWMFVKETDIQSRVGAVKRFADDVIAKVR
ncbi:MAG TPA: TIGR03619 family F420-dependent LLM class oxidoreductase [Actinomycetota bacterium]|nr:TIGR03619 family F420-dependent LLM class oxidoreductase [Actinomycetota bacterium]